jgi:AcrR family transcriptional regulator
MGRWEPDAAGRLRAAAMDLYLEQGFEKTTVAEIAERAGVTARTFFRYFADKREVLFGGSPQLQQLMVDALVNSPESATPMEAVAAALVASGEMLTDREFSRRRYDVISAHPDLRERELIKLASMAAALADGLRKRGVPDRDANLAGQTAVAVFHVAFERWATGSEDVGLADVMRDELAHLTTLTSGT